MIIRNDKVDILVTFTDINVVQKDLFTPEHHKWLGSIQDNKTFKKRSFTYQCNCKINPDAESFLANLILDYKSVRDLDGFEDFCKEYGYSSNRYDYNTLKEFNKVKSLYNKMLRNADKVEFLFNQEQIEYLKEEYADKY